MSLTNIWVDVAYMPSTIMPLYSYPASLVNEHKIPIESLYQWAAGTNHVLNEHEHLRQYGLYAIPYKYGLNAIPFKYGLYAISCYSKELPCSFGGFIW